MVLKNAMRMTKPKAPTPAHLCAGQKTPISSKKAASKSGCVGDTGSPKNDVGRGVAVEAGGGGVVDMIVDGEDYGMEMFCLLIG